MICLSSDGAQLNCTGAWVLAELPRLSGQLKSFPPKAIQNIVSIDASGITRMDTAGALALSDLVETMSPEDHRVTLLGLEDRLQPLFSLVLQETQKLHGSSQRVMLSPGAFFIIGKWAVEKYSQVLSFLAFVGELITILFENIMRPARIQWRVVCKIIDETGYRALPIIALMSFLIGIVLAYQLAHELEAYGATLFVVDVAGVAVFREFAPLITAIILAGRTSTSFAALLGTMKVNEEIDALRTMGVVPLERLVLPRIFGLIIALPLLTVWADIFGILGSMFMAGIMINLHYVAFLDRFRQVVAMKQLILGLIKTPVFALIIASVGCFQGFQTELSADSVGLQTTKAAVQAIFLIIVADAGFSILFSVMGL